MHCELSLSLFNTFNLKFQDFSDGWRLMFNSWKFITIPNDRKICLQTQNYISFNVNREQLDWDTQDNNQWNDKKCFSLYIYQQIQKEWINQMVNENKWLQNHKTPAILPLFT